MFYNQGNKWCNPQPKRDTQRLNSLQAQLPDARLLCLEGRRQESCVQLQKRRSKQTFPLPSGSVRTVCSLGTVTCPSLTVSPVDCGRFIHWSEPCLAHSSFSFIIPHLYISFKAALLISSGSVGTDWCSELQSLPVLVLLMNTKQWAQVLGGACLHSTVVGGCLFVSQPPCISDLK